MRVVVLGSGSSGNSLVVEFGEVRIAVDAGFGRRTLTNRFRAAGVAPESISACVITHEHLDHAHGAAAARKAWRWPIAATPLTLRAMGVDHAAPGVRALDYATPMTVGDTRITLIPVSHDAAAPAAVLIEDGASGARVGIAYDLGETTPGLVETFSRLDLLVLESNHEMGMLRAGSYPLSLQDRIAGRRGHLSNAQAANFAARVAHRSMRAIVLAHLSQENNTPALAHAAVANALRRTTFRGTLVTARQDVPRAIGAAPPAQLSLF